MQDMWLVPTFLEEDRAKCPVVPAIGLYPLLEMWGTGHNYILQFGHVGNSFFRAVKNDLQCLLIKFCWNIYLWLFHVNMLYHESMDSMRYIIIMIICHVDISFAVFGKCKSYNSVRQNIFNELSHSLPYRNCPISWPKHGQIHIISSY